MIEHHTAWFKVALAWLGVFVTGITLSQVAALLTIVLTLVTIYKHVHDMRRQTRRDDAEAEASAAAAKKTLNDKGETP